MSNTNSIYRINIIGAGIIGLTTACTILKEYSNNENLQLSIISEEFSPNTTGDISGGFWEPYGFEHIDERIIRWAAYSYEIFLQEFFSTKAARAGIIQVPAYALQRHSEKEFIKPMYSDVVRHYRTMDKHEISQFDHLKPTIGFVFSSIVVEISKYLPQIQYFLQSDRRVKFIRRKIHSISELKDNADVVINCTGLASRYLVNDQTIRPARGQIIRVRAPWIKSMFQFDTDDGMGYVIPQTDTIVLGGTFQLNDWNTESNENDTQKILRMCSQALPALADVRDMKVQVGLRPYRDDGVRLEHEKTDDGIDVIHCYGHSGSGMTLSWGCAKDVVELIKTLLPPNSKQETNLTEHEQLWHLVSHTEYIIHDN